MELLLAVHLNERRVFQETDWQERQRAMAVLRQMVLLGQFMIGRQDENHLLRIELCKREGILIDRLCRDDEVDVTREHRFLQTLRGVLRQLQADSRIFRLEFRQE